MIKIGLAKSAFKASLRSTLEDAAVGRVRLVISRSCWSSFDSNPEFTAADAFFNLFARCGREFI